MQIEEWSDDGWISADYSPAFWLSSTPSLWYWFCSVLKVHTTILTGFLSLCILPFSNAWIILCRDHQSSRPWDLPESDLEPRAGPVKAYGWRLFMKHKDLQRFLSLFILWYLPGIMKEMGAFQKHGMGIHSHVVEERISCNCKGPHMLIFWNAPEAVEERIWWNIHALQFEPKHEGGLQHLSPIWNLHSSSSSFTKHFGPPQCRGACNESQRLHAASNILSMTKLTLG